MACLDRIDTDTKIRDTPNGVSLIFMPMFDYFLV